MGNILIFRYWIYGCFLHLISGLHQTQSFENKYDTAFLRFRINITRPNLVDFLPDR